jgi:REP element-mobilizing transposase RayT
MFITTNTYERKNYFNDATVARTRIKTLYVVKKLYPFFLYSFVAMPDHWHLLMRVPPPGSISKNMNSWKSAVVMNTGLPKIW